MFEMSRAHPRVSIKNVAGLSNKDALPGVSGSRVCTCRSRNRWRVRDSLFNFCEAGHIMDGFKKERALRMHLHAQSQTMREAHKGWVAILY
jgi:hypothetical protein